MVFPARPVASHDVAFGTACAELGESCNGEPEFLLQRSMNAWLWENFCAACINSADLTEKGQRFQDEREYYNSATATSMPHLADNRIDCR